MCVGVCVVAPVVWFKLKTGGPLIWHLSVVDAVQRLLFVRRTNTHAQTSANKVLISFTRLETLPASSFLSDAFCLCVGFPACTFQCKRKQVFFLVFFWVFFVFFGGGAQHCVFVNMACTNWHH